MLEEKVEMQEKKLKKLYGMSDALTHIEFLALSEVEGLK